MDASGSNRRSRAVALLAIAILAATESGCSRADSRGAPVPSQLFGRVEVIGSRGSALGQFNKPRSVAVDRQDNLYVVDMTARVQKFSPRGTFLSSWRMPNTDLGKPKGMCTDNSGNIVVLEPHYQRVNHFTPDGALVEQWGRAVTNGGNLVLPRAVAINSRGQTYLSEYSTVDRVQGFSPTGRVSFICFGVTGDRDGQFNRPEGHGFSADDRLFVADSCNHRIQIFDCDGKWLRTHGRAGHGVGEFSYPYDVRMDRAGYA